MTQEVSAPTAGSSPDIKQESEPGCPENAPGSLESDVSSVDISRVLPDPVRAAAERLGAKAAAGEMDIYDVLQRLEDTVQ